MQHFDQTKPLILFRTAQETVQYQHERHRIQDSSPKKGQKIKKVIITNDKFKAQVILHTVLQRDQNKTGSQTAETIKSTDGKEANQLQSD